MKCRIFDELVEKYNVEFGEEFFVNTFNDVSYGFDLGSDIKALVEIIQNTLDAAYEAGGDYEIGVDNMVFYSVNYGKSMSYLDVRNGGSSKRKDIDWCHPIGYFGTGFPRAMCFLVNHGYRFYVLSGKWYFEPYVVREGNADFVYLKVRKVKSNGDFTAVFVEGIDKRECEEAKKKFLRFRDDVVVKFGSCVTARDSKENFSKGYAEIIMFDWVFDEDSFEYKWASEGIIGFLGIGYMRGVEVERDMNCVFSYNFCDRQLMINDSRTSFTNFDLLRGYVGAIWNEVDDVEMCKKFILLCRNYEDIYEKGISYYEPKHGEVWVKAWKELYGDVGVTNSEDVEFKYEGKFVKVNDWLYKYLKSCGVPSEKEILGVKDIELTEYEMSEYERCMLNAAIDVAALYCDLRKKGYSSKDVRKILRKHVKVYSNVVVINKALVREEDKDCFGFVVNRNIKEIYLDGNKIFRSVGFIAGVLLHELGHVKGFDDGSMDMYNVDIISNLVDDNLENLYDLAVNNFGGEVREYWKVIFEEGWLL